MGLGLTAGPTNVMLKSVLDYPANPITKYDERAPLHTNTKINSLFILQGRDELLGRLSITNLHTFI